MSAQHPHMKTWRRALVCAPWLASVCLAAACQGPQPTTDIARAIVERDDATLQALLKAGGSPEAGEPRPIIWAARSNNASAIRLLAAAGADVNRPDGGNGWTPLQHAVHKRASKAVEALLKVGADPNQGSAHSPSALMMAAGYGDRESFDLLIKGGANAAFEVQPGINALWAALGGGAIADITDGPSLGVCFPDIVAAVRKHAPTLRIQRGLETRALRFLAKKGCADLIEASL